jgi:thymidine kinase
MALPYLPHHEGWIEVVVGPMFSGKSEELIRRVKRALIAGQKVKVFKPRIDDRYHAGDVTSHDGKRAEAVPVRDSPEIRALLAQELPEVVAFDEAQFFDPGLVQIALELAEKGIRVICAGLDMDFRAEPFGIMPELLTRAEYIEKLYAVCPVCGAPATRTQRLVNGLPARYDDPIILVGASESYEPRCRKCHKVVRDEVTTLF